MKYLVTTRADSNIKEMTDLTHPIFKRFAEQWGADFEVLDHETEKIHDGRPHFRIMKCHELHEVYDRILNIDSDTIITPQCPNLFEVVPEDCIGTVLEDKGSRLPDRRSHINKVQAEWGNVGWTEGYINTGVFVTSKQHKNIFTPHQGEFYREWGSDDVHIGYNINKYKHKVFELPYTFNHMGMFSEPWNGNPSRFESYIIHYAGRGIFDSGINSRVDQIKHDIKLLWGDK